MLVTDGFDSGQAEIRMPPVAAGVFHRLTHCRSIAAGRGAVRLCELDGSPVVVRHYRRGGAVRGLGDRFLWRGLQRTRVWRELALLAQLREHKLPVVQGLAGRVSRMGLWYRADIITAFQPGQPLAMAGLDGFRIAGRAIAQCHNAGFEHPDLNANNILVDADQAFLIDWDRAPKRHRTVGAWQQGNLDRLRRSLRKLGVFRSNRWQALIDAWRAGLTARSQVP